MAYSPATDTKVVYANTKEEMDGEVQALLAQGYYPVSLDTLYDGKLADDTHAYRQAMVKLANTDAQFISTLANAFKPMLDDIEARLNAMDTKLQTIADNTAK